MPTHGDLNFGTPYLSEKLSSIIRQNFRHLEQVIIMECVQSLSSDLHDLLGNFSQPRCMMAQNHFDYCQG